MTGTILVYAEPAVFRRAGTLGVIVDGVKAGRVRQGTAARFPVAAGTHTVRVAARGRIRSTTVTVEVPEGRDSLVTARGTGLAVALLLPPVAGATVPGPYVMGSVLLIGVLFNAFPGLLFRVRADGAPEPRTARDDRTARDRAGDEENGGTGLWWETDPALAKRFRKGAGS